VALSPGQSLGPYEIVEKIGEGGMGAVYRARDTRLNRSVAIKLLPEELTAHPKLRERLTREARAISALSHPNICALYDIGHQDGFDYLVMEFLEGETLADRIARGPIPLRQALRYGAEIASALDAAHRAGVIHRDLKPGNVILTRSGARLLDFGLARHTESASDSAAMTARPLTEPGMVVGTLYYMSPEQIGGQTVDARSDIFSFGVLLYEMLTGRRPFDATSRSGLISAILAGSPGPLPEDIPEAVRRLVQNCLEKSPEDRWQSAHDLADELQWIAGTSGAATSSPRSAARWRWPAALIAIAGAFVIAMALYRPSLQPRSPIRFGINPPPETSFTQRATNNEFAVSPDGVRLAFVARRGHQRQLFVRRLDELAAQEIAGTDGALSPFWSPDSKWIGFFTGGVMKRFRYPAGRP